MHAGAWQQSPSVPAAGFDSNGTIMMNDVGADILVRNDSYIGDSMVGTSINHRSLLQQAFDSRWFAAVIANRPTVLCRKGERDGDPSTATLSYGRASPQYMASTNVRGSRRHTARNNMCSAQRSGSGWSFTFPYAGPVTIHHVIPQNALCAALNTWWSAAQQNATHRTALLSCLNNYWQVVRNAQVNNGIANIKMYHPDNPSGDWWAAGDVQALSYLSASIMWNVGNTVPGPEPHLRATSMPDPGPLVDQAILNRLQVGTGTANINTLYRELSAAITAIQAVPTNAPATAAIPTCTTFFQHFTAIAGNPLEAVAAQTTSLSPLNNFWRMACNGKNEIHRLVWVKLWHHVCIYVWLQLNMIDHVKYVYILPYI
jgi:hypothetical protein